MTSVVAMSVIAPEVVGWPAAAGGLGITPRFGGGIDRRYEAISEVVP
jgi:hypothetical protein